MNTKFSVMPSQLAMNLTVPAASKTLTLDAQVSRGLHVAKCTQILFDIQLYFSTNSNLQSTGLPELEERMFNPAPLFPLLLGEGLPLTLARQEWRPEHPPLPSCTRTWAPLRVGTGLDLSLLAN